MDIAVVGLGSMGKRRIRLVQKYIAKNELDNWSIIGVDLDASRREEVEKELGILTCQDFNQIKDKLDAVIVSTSPSSHASIVISALKAKKHVFCEINLNSDRYEEIIALMQEVDKTLFLSSTFLYRDEINYIEERVRESKTGSYFYHVGQYLPDWHPWEDYRTYFVANKRTNACRELLAIELPWLQHVFGTIEHVKSVHTKISELDLPYDDFYSLIIKHEDGTIGSLQVDVVCRKAIRNFEFSSEDTYITWDGTAAGLRDFDIESKQFRNIDLYSGEACRRKEYAEFVVENAYYNEIDAFFRAIEGDFQPSYSYEDDFVTLGLIDEIERE